MVTDSASLFGWSSRDHSRIRERKGPPSQHTSMHPPSIPAFYGEPGAALPVHNSLEQGSTPPPPDSSLGCAEPPGKRSQEQTSHRGKVDLPDPSQANMRTRRGFGGMGVEQAQPAADRADAIGLSLHSFCQNPFLSCLQGKKYSRASKKKSTATRPKTLCVQGQITRACPPVQRAWGYPATATRDHRQPPPEEVFCSLRRDSGGEADPQRGREEQRGTKEAGKGQLIQTPRTTSLTSPSIGFPAQGQRAEGLEAPTLATQSGP